MKVIIISGTAESDVPTIQKLADKYHYNSNLILMWPEVSDRPVHPAILDKKIQEKVERCIDEDRDVIICTYNDIVFNAARVAIHRKHASGVLYALGAAGSVSSSNIMSSGRLDNWFDGVFDTWDNQLDSILDV